MIIRLIRDFFGRLTEDRGNGARHLIRNNSDNISTPRITNIVSNPSNNSKSNNPPFPVFSFKRSYLMDFSDNREPLIYLSGKLYTLGKKTDNPKEGIIYQNRCHKLEELEGIVEMENQMIESNREKIQSFQKEALYFYAKKQDLENLESLEASDDYSSLSSFILNYLIPAHIKKINESKNDIPKKIETDKIKLKPIIFPNGLSVLETLTQGWSKSNHNLRGFALIDGGVYLIQKDANLDKSEKSKRAEEFESEYLKHLSDGINHFVNSDIFSCLKKVNKSLPLKKKSLENVPNSINGLYFQKNSEKEYITYVNTGEYTMGHDGKFYHFGSTNVGISVYSLKDKIKFSERPFIYNHPTYNHPLVFGSSNIKQICLGAANDASYRRAKWRVTSDTDSPTELAYGILETLRRGKNIITCGCTNDNSNITYANVEDCGRKISLAAAKTMELTGVPIFYGG